MSDDSHLTAEEVEVLLQFVKDYNPIIVGGQSINIWAELFRGRNHELDALSPLTSKDIDFFHNLKAEKALAAALQDGVLRIPKMDDNTPEAAVVSGYLGDKKVTVDFLSHVLGVESSAIVRRSITFSDPENTAVSVILMHPLDCVRSRLANINTLDRTDDHSITQARASLIILDCFIDSELAKGERQATRRATAALREIEEIAVNQHFGKTSAVTYDHLLNLTAIIEKYRLDRRLDERFRDIQLAGILDRLRTRANKSGDI